MNIFFRFMVTLCELQLEENPLTCPPANLCGRGRVHIFKYLEIQVSCFYFYILYWLRPKLLYYHVHVHANEYLN